MAVLLAVLGVADRAWSQEDAEEGPSVGGVTSSGGLGFYFPKRWGTAQAGVRNPGEEPIRPWVRFFFNEQNQRWFEQRVWVPPKAQRRVPFPVRFDGSADEGGGDEGDSSRGRSVETETVLLAEEGDRKRELSRRSSVARMVQGETPFAIVTSAGQAREDHVVKTMGKLRAYRRLPSRMGYLRDRDLMHYEAGWEGLDVVALTGEKPQLDAAQRRALKRWVREGGTLVVFAHRADHTTMNEILGEAWGVSLIDRVTLNTLRFRDADRPRTAATAAGAAGGGATRSELTVEQPISMARVIAPGYEAALTVRGWPALLRRAMGRGQIVVPTVGGRAWRHEGAEEVLRVLGDTVLGEVSRDPSERSKAEAVVQGEAGRVFVSKQVGYRVVSRSKVALMLGAFIIALSLGTWMWMRSGRLERLGPLGVVAAVLVTAVLVMMGQRTRQDAPPTRAGLRFVQAEPGAARHPVQGMMALFDGSGRSRTLRARDGGTAWPTLEGRSGSRGRLIIKDLDRLVWRDLSLPPAEKRWVQYRGGARLERPLEMGLQYGEAGLSGEIRGPADRPFSDALLVTERANLDVSLERSTGEQGRTQEAQIGPEQVLDPGVLLTGGRISRTERERASLVEAMLERAPFQRPTLLAWTGGLDAGLGVEPELRRQEHALWAIPLAAEETPAGEPVRVPWPLLRMQPRYDRAEDLGLRMRPIYSRTRGWTEEASGSSAFVARFAVPEAVRPMRLEEAVVHLEITALGRPVRILAVRDGQTSVVETLDSPDGRSTVRIPGDQLSFDDRGGLTLAFDVGGVEGGGSEDARGREEIRGSQFWSVRRFGLEIAGTKVERE